MADESYPSSAHDYATDAEEIERIDAAAADAPKGAILVAGIAVGALLAGWLILYIFIFIPRGTVG